MEKQEIREHKKRDGSEKKTEEIDVDKVQKHKNEGTIIVK